MQETRFSKVKNGHLKLEKDFIELKNRKLKYREVKVRREIKELFFKPITVSIDGTGKFQQKELRRKDLLKTLGMTG